MPKAASSRDDAAAYYRDNMHSYLTKSKLPPTEWELHQQHQSVHKETLDRFGLFSNDVNNNRFHAAIEDVYDQVKRNHKQLRFNSHIESVLGRKNYVGDKNSR